jgi:putative ATPase
MRPLSIDDLVGQDKLLAPGAPLRRLVSGGPMTSVILWGPPGTGQDHDRASGRAGQRPPFRGIVGAQRRCQGCPCRHRRGTPGPPYRRGRDRPLHRRGSPFSKTQQDSLLSAVEDGTVTLLAATTENPYFSVISPLLSRCVLLTLQPLDDEAVRGLVRKALADPRGLGGTVTLAADAEDHLVRLAGGDVRKALTALEAGAEGAAALGVTEIDLAIAEAALDKAALRYDRDGDAHYDVVSAFIKSMRGSDVDASLHYLARMLMAGEDPRFIARRMVIFASEDVGMADPTALTTATAAATRSSTSDCPRPG